MHRRRPLRSILRTLQQVVACTSIALLTACGDTGGSAPRTESAGTPSTTTADNAPTNESTNASTDPANATAPSGQPAATASTEIGPIFVTFVSKSGSIRVELFPKEAPRTCVNFLNLARRGYYIGKPWDDFSPVVRQLGTAVDLKDLPYQLPREFSPKYLFDKGGLLCLANTTEDERARGHPCRIFLTVKPQERWNLVYPVFGRVVSGLDVAESLIPGEPVAEVRIEGGADALLAKYAKQVGEWNAILEKTPMP
jgi:peptidyl-prolyl cis-trans isomerase B (cyclophilin B)